MHTLALELYNRPAILERVLQITRYRQFDLLSLHLEETSNGRLAVTMSVKSQYSINLLTSQLNKLYDLARLELQTSLPLAATA